MVPSVIDSANSGTFTSACLTSPSYYLCFVQLSYFVRVCEFRHHLQLVLHVDTSVITKSYLLQLTLLSMDKQMTMHFGFRFFLYPSTVSKFGKSFKIASISDAGNGYNLSTAINKINCLDFSQCSFKR